MTASLISTRDLRVGHPGGPIFAHPDLHWTAGTVVITGANGIGKSTLLRTLAGIIPPRAGAVAVAGIDLVRDPVAAKRRIGWAADSLPVPPSATAQDLLEIVRWAHRIAPSVRDRWVQRFGVDAWLHRPLGSCSLGQQRRTILASALMPDPPVLLLDEPTVGLDEHGIGDLAAIIRERNQRSVLTVLITHETAWLAGTETTPYQLATPPAPVSMARNPV